MKLTTILGAVALCVSSASAETCTTPCENEFLNGCLRHYCREEGMSKGEAWQTCRDQIDDGHEILINAGCTKGCTSTPEMNDAKNVPCSSGPTQPESGGNQPDESCTIIPKVKPTAPEVCSSDNQGCCPCGKGDVTTYVFWSNGGTMQRCMHTVNIPKTTPKGGPIPVVLASQGYARNNEQMGNWAKDAKYYGFAAMSLSSFNGDAGPGGFSLQFGNNNIANDTYPTPCSEKDSREISYLNTIIAFIESMPQLLDASKVYTTGFSQESMFSGYAAICLAGKIAGVFQGGSGMAKTGYLPVTPGHEAQCSKSSVDKNGDNCCSKDFCEECKYWPAYPRTCENKIIMCLSMYTGDFACGSDYYMYEAAVKEGNDARLLSFPGGDHKWPENNRAWLAGCLGLSETCSKACEASFTTCMGNGVVDPAKFEQCEKELRQGSLSNCVVGCSPSLDMLMLSEKPVASLSEGRFGRQTGLTRATSPAPKPKCATSFGPFFDGGVGNCKPSAGTRMPGPENVVKCSDSSPNDDTSAPTLRVQTGSPTVYNKASNLALSFAAALITTATTVILM